MAENKCSKGYERVNESCKKTSVIQNYRKKNLFSISIGFVVGILVILLTFGGINFQNNKEILLGLACLFSLGWLFTKKTKFSDIPKYNKNVIYLIIFAIAINVLVMLIYQTYAWSAVVLSAMGFISIMFLISRNYDYEDIRGNDHNKFTDLFIGIGFVALLVAFSKALPLIGAIGIPYLPESIADNLSKLAIIVISTPIIEESFFRVFIQHLFKNLKLPFIVIALITALLFSIFHLTSYGGSYAGASGSFITAMIAGLIFSGLAKYSNSNIANTSAHFSFNLFVLLPIIGVTGAIPLIILVSLTVIFGAIALITRENKKK